MSGYKNWNIANLHVSGNVYLGGAKPSANEREALVVTKSYSDIKLEKRPDGWWLEMPLDTAWQLKKPRGIVTTELLGKAKAPDLPYENPDGTPYRLDKDYFRKQRSAKNPAPGPFQFGSKEVVRIKVWPRLK